MEDIYKDISKLSPEKRKLFELLLKEQDVSLKEKIFPQSRDTNRFPLSFAQQRMWFLDQLDPGSPMYNNPAAVLLRGEMNVTALEKTLNALTQRHEVLRTTFESEGGKPVQIIHPGIKLEIDQLDFSNTSKENKDRILRDEADKISQERFDLSKGPLLRIKLVRLGEKEHVFLLTMHHVISDAWTLGIFIKEFAQLYKAFASGKTPELAPLSLQYVDFACWQRDWLQGEVLDKQLNYWKEKLYNSSPLDLPTDFLRPKYQTFNGDVFYFSIDKKTTEQLDSFCRQNDVTQFMALLAILNLLLYRYTGQNDISVGTPFAGRNRTETEFMMGVFINTLVMRTDLSGEPTFKKLLGRVKETALGAYGHQDIPFETIVEALKPERDMSRPPFFQTMFVLQNAPMQPLQLADIEIEPLEIHTPTAKFDLTLVLEQNDEGMAGQIVYNTDLFRESTMKRLIGHFGILLKNVCEKPDWPISHIPILTKDEQDRIKSNWNLHPSPGDFQPGKCIHEYFESQVEKTPDQLIVCDGETISYRELNHRANQLARYLNSLDISRQDVVGLYLERSLDLLIGMLGILKSGGVYLPLDPDFPQDRIAFMIKDTKASIVLSHLNVAETLPQSSIKSICLDTEWPKINFFSHSNLQLQIEPENTAYVIYTSGSTGTPKGVLIPHGAIARHSVGMKDFYELTENDRVLQFASTNFDASLEQIFPTLIAGSKLILRGKQVWSPDELINVVKEHQLTVINPPTAYWNQIIQNWAKTVDVNEEQPVRLVIVGGDLMTTDSLKPWRESSLKRARLLNAYGPTETTITSTIFDISAYSSELQEGAIPIGKGLLERSIYILDQRSNPVPIGVPGELFIGGFALARGYLNRPDITAEKFIPNPFSKKEGERIYRTGDLVRYLKDGNIEFLGRIDHQVKIRGYRIELGEIESIFGLYTALDKVVVVAREKEQKEKVLAAYYVCRNETKPTVNQLRDFLSERLPDYMIPGTFMELEKMPMTPGGKIDRRVLPEPDHLRPQIETEFIAPRTNTEQKLVDIVSEILNIEKVGVHDNFFDLGGHSMLGTQVISRIREEFGVELALRALFENPTVEGLARAITEEQAASQKDEDLDAMLNELEGLSDEDVMRLLEEQDN